MAITVKTPVRKAALFVVPTMLLALSCLLSGCTSPIALPGDHVSEIMGASVAPVRAEGAQNSPIDLVADCGLNESIIARIQGCTLLMYITSPSQTEAGLYRYVVRDRNATLNTSAPATPLQISKPKQNTAYKVSFRLAVDSQDAELQKLNLLGLNNCLNITFRIDSKRVVAISIDKEYKGCNCATGAPPGTTYADHVWLTHRHWTDATGDHDAGHKYQVEISVCK